MTEGTEVARITITRVITEDNDLIGVDATEGLTVIEGLGMLRLAEATWLETHGLRDADDDEL